MDKERLIFPQGFLWGAATSSHQVEGGNINNWSEWEKQNANRLAIEAKSKFDHLPNWEEIKDQAENPQNYISGSACDHYNRFEEDFDLAKELGHSAHRFSLEWSRIEPEKGNFSQKQLDHYKKVLQALNKRNIEPFVTLWHWTNPLWLRDRGGWLNQDTPKYFEQYVGKVIDQLGDLAEFWITLNEPMIFIRHFLGQDSPRLVQDPRLIKKVVGNLISAHKKAYQIINQKGNKAGISKNCLYFQGWPLNVLPKASWNHYFLRKIRKEQDFIGLNYYRHHNLYKQTEFTLSDLGWEINPKGIYHVLLELKKYDKPIYITENGLADASDQKRAEFIIEHLKWVYQAMLKGVNVRGYLHWSLLDNFEWDKGFWPRFGLIEVDFKTQQRRIRPSAKLYAEICRNNKLINMK